LSFNLRRHRTVVNSERKNDRALKPVVTTTRCNCYSSTILARICFTAKANAAKPMMTIRLVSAPPNKALWLSRTLSGTPISPAAASAAFADVDSKPMLLELALRSSQSRLRWFSRISCHSHCITINTQLHQHQTSQQLQNTRIQMKYKQ